MIVVAMIWGVALPRLGQTPSVRTMIDRNDALGIDPSAKFYTETASTQHALTRLSSLHRRQPDALWTTE